MIVIIQHLEIHRLKSAKCSEIYAEFPDTCSGRYLIYLSDSWILPFWAEYFILAMHHSRMGYSLCTLILNLLAKECKGCN